MTRKNVQTLGRFHAARPNINKEGSYPHRRPSTAPARLPTGYNSDGN